MLPMMTSLMFYWALYKQCVPDHFRAYFEKYWYKIIRWFAVVDENVYIRISEYTGNILKTEAYDSISKYLSAKSIASATRFQGHDSKNRKSLVLSLEDYDVVEDEFEGVKVKWTLNVTKSGHQSMASHIGGSEESRYLTLSFHGRHREIITKTYTDHVLREGREIGLKDRERRLYTLSQGYSYGKKGRWSNVPFDHPATFETLAMDPEKKEAIKKDLIRFSKAKDYYRKVGKPWKRGYLLFGPPGTGKSTMISAMANFLEYDVYDLELTTLGDNLELKKVMLDTTEKSILVIEDIDCSLDLTGQRKKKKSVNEEEVEDEDEDEEKHERKVKKSNITLSGLLNAIDGLWSACTSEKIIVFTTNFVENLDPALIRQGRMDNHIEMSYCRFEAFKALAKNYLDTEAHELYGEIEILLEETNMSPAHVAENLMPKSDEEDADICLKRLVKSLEEEKEKAKKLAEEEKKKKVEREARRNKKKKAKEEEKNKEKEENGDIVEEMGKRKGKRKRGRKEEAKREGSKEKLVELEEKEADENN